ncbi:HlyD family secretion protein [Celeribacter indicus]|uniref:Multidrug resistance protein K n=1 Tax=Celeribacter indicus TaxID=1208324 RepID=A0A0B5DQS3_9RHOB|nr:HlyD family secretion protein [Celeribacter indicus]AJE45444.1 multidrug resistance protein K [Celeribacter indicus]SDX02148.1 membrane fusion protein, multidrug efflux system [Celeribacter indicus]
MKQDRQSAEDAEPVAAETVTQTGSGAPDSPQVPKRRRKAILGALGLVVVLAGAVFGYGWWTTGRFMVETDDAYVQADITEISSRVQGYVTGLGITANQHVQAGDVLVRLDDGDYRLALETARSRYESAGDTLVRIDAQIEAAQAAVAQAEAGRDAARAQLTNAGTSLDRARNLAERNVTAQSTLDAATAAHDTARANLASADAAITSAEAQIAVLRAQRAEAEGTQRQLAIAVRQAESDLDKTVLRATADGIVANIAVERGDLVQPGARLAALVPDDGLYIEANFKETQMDGVRPGAEVHLSFDALPGRDFEATVASAAPATGSIFSLLPAENATGNFTKIVQRVPVRIEVPQDALETGQLRAGLSVIVEVDSRTGTAPGHGTEAPAHQIAATAE